MNAHCFPRTTTRFTARATGIMILAGLIAAVPVPNRQAASFTIRLNIAKSALLSR